ncbi:flavodoxin domain-containing protein [Anaerocolumna xylanovorans]|uniref:Flavodoxin domain-containing protein n=1 Tax=Anaerocolumna xylanovorans DSM 12503 TaxID=1121345 RepID=A0A1M7XWM4_9FIRM|nr:flavodoxin domain-containing protein [Anaerocolumna xylanovorans]SHO43004.1 Flavodoxin domain-containing protein [Anaerocolumna xylanovorans DSM 12503]
MSKSRIVYATKTRHSKKLALAMGKALNVQADNVADNPALEEVGLLFIVGGIYGGGSLPELLEFVKKLDKEKVKKAALVTSSATKKQGQDMIRKLLEEKGIPVAEELLSQGSFLFMKIGHPGKDDVKEAAEFAVRLSERVKE